MISKPASCQGCPLYGDGKGFVSDAIVEGPDVLILAQNPGADEERGQRVTGYVAKQPVYEPCTPQPLIGKTGYELRRTFIPLAGLKPEHVSYANVLKCRYIENGKRSNNMPTGKAYTEAVGHCTKAHLHIPESVRLIVTHGAYAWEYAQGTDEYKLSDWRGFVGPTEFHGRPVFATLHTADLFRERKKGLVARMDWKRIGRYLSGAWPRSIPPRVVVGRDNEREVTAAFDRAHDAEFIAVDTEWIVESGILTICGLAWDGSNGVEGVQIEWLHGDIASEQRSKFIRRYAALVKRVPVVFWNAKADVPVIERAFHVGCNGYAQIEDAMQAHAVLWSELPHDYEFVASTIGQYPKLKHLSKTDPMLYNFGDVIDLTCMWRTLRQELHDDPPSEKVYRGQNLRLIPITLERERLGLRVNQTRVQEAIPAYRDKMHAAQCMAEAYCGFPLNLGSPAQLKQWVVGVEGLKLKSVDQDEVAEKRKKFLPFDADEEEKSGVGVEYVLERVESGAHPLFEARILYAQSLQVESHYLRPLLDKERCYPEFHLHTQASGRHSTVHPPLAQFPEDLLDLVIPDEGDVWFGFDFEAQEPRLLMGYSRSQVLKDAFEHNRDIHTEFVCQIYGWEKPPDGFEKGDVRRVFAKQARYEIWYLGTGHNALDRAVRLGADKAQLERALSVLRNSDHAILAYQRRMRAEIEKTHTARTWAGRKRIYISSVGSKSAREEMVRALYNHRNQGGGADIYNQTIIALHDNIPEVKWQYGRHDSMWLGMKRELFTPDLAQRIEQIVEQPRSIDGEWVKFPASYKVMDDQGNVQEYKP